MLFIFILFFKILSRLLYLTYISFCKNKLKVVRKEKDRTFIITKKILFAGFFNFYICTIFYAILFM